jgi:hypothetical protein
VTGSGEKPRLRYTFADWKAHVMPPLGWDVADAVDDGWTRREYEEFLRFSVLGPWEKPPPFPVAEAPAPRPAPAAPPRPRSSSPPVGPLTSLPSVGAILDGIPRTHEVDHRSEVFLAQRLATQLRQAFGGHVVHTEGAFWVWHGTEWIKLLDQDVRRLVHRYDRAIVTTGTSNLKIGKRAIDGILAEAATILGDPLFFAEPTVGLNAANGVIRIAVDGSVALNPHDPADRFRFTIPADFDGLASSDLPGGSYLHRLLEGAFRRRRRPEAVACGRNPRGGSLRYGNEADAAEGIRFSRGERVEWKVNDSQSIGHIAS